MARFRALILVVGSARPGPRGHPGTPLAHVPPEVLRKYASSKPLFRPKPRQLPKGKQPTE
jgi:hypothetical protein